MWISRFIELRTFFGSRWFGDPSASYSTNPLLAASVNWKLHTMQQEYFNTYLSSLPFNFRRFWGRVSTLIQVELFWQSFVLKVWVLIEVLKQTKNRQETIDLFDKSGKQRENSFLQNLFCNPIWCPQTLWPPPWSGSEVLPHLPHQAGLKLSTPRAENHQHLILLD